MECTVQPGRGRPAGDVEAAKFLKRRTCPAKIWRWHTFTEAEKHVVKGFMRGRAETDAGLMGNRESIGSGVSCWAQRHSYKRDATCQPDAAGLTPPSKKQLGTIIATYKLISSMIKMFGAGRTRSQVVVISIRVALGRRWKRAKERKNPLSCLFRHLCVWSSTSTPFFCIFAPLAKASVP